MLNKTFLTHPDVFYAIAFEKSMFFEKISRSYKKI